MLELQSQYVVEGNAANVQKLENIITHQGRMVHRHDIELSPLIMFCQSKPLSIHIGRQCRATKRAGEMSIQHPSRNTIHVESPVFATRQTDFRVRSACFHTYETIYFLNMMSAIPFVFDSVLCNKSTAFRNICL